ncbi:MAG: LysM peptidoglycan-binding domain-containing protein [Gammaproteobacteria bacterium]|nr:LysM peptidoglycan-binding domain-containing protein [Gammaproteobacteria bacterium]
MMIKRVCILILALFAITSTSAVYADEIVLKNQHPSNYVIKDGDTLWDIASRFLRDPWRWPDIWQVNPQIKNPHLIYPGDEVVLTFKDGKPQLVLKRGNTTQDNLRTVKLSPTVRKRQLSKAVPTIPIDAIQQFLSRPSVLSNEAMENLPYVLRIQDNHLISGTNDTIYVRGIIPGSNTRYSIVRTGDEYIDIVDGDEVSVGQEAIYIGEAKVEKFGDPSTVMITHAKREALVGDRLIPAVPEMMEYNFIPHAPKNLINGRIISVIDGVSRIGQYQIVVVNKGSEHGMEKGHVMAIFQAGETIDDPMNEDRSDEVTLPSEHSGYLLLFRIFNKISYALIMKATRDIHLMDSVTNP